MSGKKGNVDACMVFEIMYTVMKKPDSFDGIILVTGDGDFYRTVTFLIEEGRFEKVLHPTHKNVSSLYRN